MSGNFTNIPPMYLWGNKGNNCVTTPDDGFLYLSHRAVVYIASVAKDAPPDIRVFSSPLKPIALDLDPSWGKPYEGHRDYPTGKYFAVGFEDNSIQIWDFEKEAAICGHRAHKDDKNNWLLIKYMIDGNLMSIDQMHVVVHCLSANTYISRSMKVFLGKNNQVTALCCSPIESQVFALGMQSGKILICDLTSMSVLHTLSDRDKSILSLDWIIEPLHENKAETTYSKRAHLLQEINKTDDRYTFDIYNFDNENDFGAPTTSTLASETEYHGGVERVGCTSKLNFLEQCDHVKQDIERRRAQNDEVNSIKEFDILSNEVTLDDCKKHNDENEIDDGSIDNDFMHTPNRCAETSSARESTNSEESRNENSANKFVCHQAVIHAESSSHEDGVPDSILGAAVSEEPFLKKSSLILSLSTSGVVLWNASKAMLYDKISFREHNKNQMAALKKISWISPYVFYATDRYNNVKSWTIVRLTEGFGGYKITKSKIHELAINVRSFAHCPRSNNLWILKPDTKIIRLDTATMQRIIEYDGFYMNIKHMHPCPTDPNKILMLAGGHACLLWDLSNFSRECISVKTIKMKNYRLTTISWNTDGTKAAIGTDCGAVIVYDVESQQIINNFKKVFSGVINSIIWKDSHILFTVEGNLCIYENPCRKKGVLEIPIKATEELQPTVVSVHSDHLFIGTARGELWLASCNWQKNFEITFKQNAVISTRALHYIEWCPTQQNRMCVIGPHVIALIDFDIDNLALLVKIAINNTACQMISVNWNSSGLFVTANTKGCIQVWNGLNPSDKPILSKSLPYPIFTAIFLPTDEDLIIFTGKNTCGSFFSIKEILESKTDLREETNDALKWATEALTRCNISSNKKKRKRTKRPRDKLTTESNLSEKAEWIKAIPRSDGGSSSFEHVDEPQVEKEEFKTYKAASNKPEEDISFAESNRSSEFFKGPAITLLTLTRNELNKSALEKLKIVLEGDAQAIQESVFCAKFFGTSAAAKELLTAELNHTKLSNGKPFDTIITAQMNCSLEDEIKTCIKERRITEWHVSLAPSVSQKFWSDCCLAYADQLATEGYIMQAVSYLIAVRSKERAIMLLLSEKYYSEALLLARIFLKATSTILSTIVKEWIDYLEGTGQLAAAALICVLDNDLVRAFHIIHKLSAKNNDAKSILKCLSKLTNLEVSTAANEEI